MGYRARLSSMWAQHLSHLVETMAYLEGCKPMKALRSVEIRLTGLPPSLGFRTSKTGQSNGDPIGVIIPLFIRFYIVSFNP